MAKLPITTVLASPYSEEPATGRYVYTEIKMVEVDGGMFVARKQMVETVCGRISKEFGWKNTSLLLTAEDAAVKFNSWLDCYQTEYAAEIQKMRNRPVSSRPRKAE